MTNQRDRVRPKAYLGRVGQIAAQEIQQIRPPRPQIRLPRQRSPAGANGANDVQHRHHQ